MLKFHPPFYSQVIVTSVRMSPLFFITGSYYVAKS